jgi:hypothetical protein
MVSYLHGFLPSVEHTTDLRWTRCRHRECVKDVSGTMQCIKTEKSELHDWTVVEDYTI